MTSRTSAEVSWRERVRSLPNAIGMLIALVIFVFGVVVATLPYEVTAPDGTTVECASAMFELVVPSDDATVPHEALCESSASDRLLLSAVAVGVAIVGGVAMRQIRKRRYDPRRYDIVDARAR